MLELLLAHADDGEPVLADRSISADAAHTGPPRAGEALETLDFRYDASDPNVLPIQRWGVIAPEDEAGDRLLGAIQPLIEHRREDQDGAPVTIYRVPPKQDVLQAHAWKSRVYWNEAVAEEDTPKYLLLLGDLDQISLPLQQALASDIYVGRLTCPTEQGYESYVAKLIARERATRANPRSLFYTARDGTAATTIGQRSLMEPTIAGCRARLGSRELVEIPHEAYSPREGLFEELTKPDPAVVFSISHGLGIPKKGWSSPAEQRALQGAMSLGLGGRVAAEDVEKGPFIPGGIWFYLACYGAATPAESAYHRWLGELQATGNFAGKVDSVLAALPRDGEKPFVAALPQSALANPDGPLAIISHADLAWTYAFRDMGSAPRDRPSRFAGVFRALVDGARVGAAHHQLLRFYAEASVELAAAYEAESNAALRANLWMLRQDLAGYLLLGDPAARVTGPARNRPAARKGPTTVELGAPAPDLDELERAVIDVLKGESVEAIAQRAKSSTRDVERWVELYRTAGRAALEKCK